MSAPFRWPEGRSCAVSLTYDDALPVHYEHVGPELEAHGLRGTFYINIAADPTRNPARWRDLAARGHELGNHTLFHPCRRYPLRRHPWLEKSFDLRDYTPDRLRQELRVANAFLHLLDGRTERTFAHTCCDMNIGRLWNEEPISNLIRGDFVAARAERTDRPIAVSRSLDLMHLGSYVADGRRVEDLRDKIAVAQGQAAWLILTMHGIGTGTHASHLEREAHSALIGGLAAQEQIWVKPFIDVAKWVQVWQTDTPS